MLIWKYMPYPTMIWNLWRAEVTVALVHAACVTRNLIFSLVMVKPVYIAEKRVVTFQYSKYHVILG